jgi:hypothetical protein
MRYKLKVYQKQIPDFVCGGPTNTEALDKDEARLRKIVQEEEVQTKKP